MGSVEDDCCAVFERVSRWTTTWTSVRGMFPPISSRSTHLPKQTPFHSRQGKERRRRDTRYPKRIHPHARRRRRPIQIVTRQHHPRHLTLRDVGRCVEHRRKHRVEQRNTGAEAFATLCSSPTLPSNLDILIIASLELSHCRSRVEEIRTTTELAVLKVRVRRDRCRASRPGLTMTNVPRAASASSNVLFVPLNSPEMHDNSET